MASSMSRPDDHRRKWDPEEYEKKALERLEADEAKLDEQQVPVKRELLKRRDYSLNLESQLGKRSIITKSTPECQSGGFYCKECDCVVKDSLNYLDHLNSRQHQKNLGMSMRIERSSLDQVRSRFERNKEKMQKEKKDYDLAMRLKEIEEEEDSRRQHRSDKRKQKKRKLQQLEEDDASGGGDPDMMAVMGFSGFGSSKK